MWSLWKALGGGLLILVAVLAIRAARLESRQPAWEDVSLAQVDAQRPAENLSNAIRHRTISFFDSDRRDRRAFLGFHSFLRETFPAVRRALDRELVGELSLLYRWLGSDESLEPVLLLAHQDVVPVPPDAVDSWTHPPFSGAIADGFVWGRGTMDDKSSLMAILEAVERLLDAGFAPRRTVFLAFGHDEEVGGAAGASAIAETLEGRGVRAAFVLDEGSAVLEAGVVGGIDSPLALVGVAEKGYLSVELSVKAAGGHSSMPPPTTAVGTLATAIYRLERNPMPTRLEGTTQQLFEYLGPEFPFHYRLLFANLWLFRPVLEWRLAKDPPTNAMLRTTTAATMIEGSPKDNVLPSYARAVVNFRILPGDNVQAVLAHVRRVVDDPRVAVEPLRLRREPTTPSDVESPDFQLLARTIREVFGPIPVAPNLVLGGTDARHYERVSPDLYRFSPIRVSREDVSRAHGIDERLSVSSHAQAIRFFMRLIRNAAS